MDQHLEAAASKGSSGCTKEWNVCLEYIFRIITPACVICSCRLSLLAAGAGSVVFCCCSRSAGVQGCYNERATVSQLQMAPASAPLSLQRREEIRLLCLRMALNIEFLLSWIQIILFIWPSTKFLTWPLGKRNSVCETRPDVKIRSPLNCNFILCSIMYT